MPPKKSAVDSTEAANPLEALTASVRTMAASIEAMREELSTSSLTINNLSTKMAHIENILNTTQAENNFLKKELADSNLESNQLKAKLNNLEQHHRSWSVRVTGLKIPAEDEFDSNMVKVHLYEQLLRPILEGAVSKHILPTLPTACEIIERAHILPAKEKATKSVIARFYCRDMRSGLQAEEGVCPEREGRGHHQEQQRGGREPCLEQQRGGGWPRKAPDSPPQIPDLRRPDKGQLSKDEGHRRR